MSNSGKKYTNEKMMEIGQLNVERDWSIRELAEEFDVSKSTVSKAKDVYVAYRDGRQTGEREKERDMKEKVSRLENRIERLSSKENETVANESSEIDPQDYVKNPEQDKIREEENEEDESGWGWIAVGLGVLVGAGSVIFRDLTE